MKNAILSFLIIVLSINTTFANTNNTISNDDIVLYQAAQAWVVHDYTSAYQLFKTRAEEGNPIAQDRLASLYFFGQGVPQNYQLAFQWFDRAANKDMISSQYMMAHMYLQGLGVNKNYLLARTWLNKIAHFQSPKTNIATNNTTLGHELTDLAYFNARKSQMKWVLLAQRDLANVFAHGLGVTANATEAYAWYSLVAAQGDHYSRTQQISLWKQMTLPQRENALQLAKKYAASYGI